MNTCWLDLLSLLILVLTIVGCYLYLSKNKQKRDERKAVMKKFFKNDNLSK